jgi:predicted regulator of Ras-like GTPase activity (Roadblock/LC7/MglB family)
MRPGVASYTSERDDRAFMEVGPHLMSGIAERLSSTGAGKVQSLIVNLEKDAVLLLQVGEGHLAISADRSEAPNVFKEVEPKIREL